MARSYTYGVARGMAMKFGSALTRLGGKRGDVMGMVRITFINSGSCCYAQVLPNIPEFPIAFLGAAGAGITVTTANPTYRLRLFVDCSMFHFIFLCTSSPVYTCS